MRPLLLAGSSPGPGSLARGCSASSSSSASVRGRIAALPRQAAPPPTPAPAAAASAAAAAFSAAAGLLLATSSALFPLPAHAAAAAAPAAGPPQQQQRRQQTQLLSPPPLLMCPPLADLAAAAGPNGSGAPATPPPPALSLQTEPPEESEYRDPFTLYGTTQKQFAIERLDGEKVVSRRRGFTVDACTAALAANDEAPALAALPPSEKVRTSATTVCRRGTGADLLPTCAGACQASCAAAVEGQAARGLDATGLRLGGRDARSVLRRCARDCTSECQKSGKAHDYSVPFRP